MIRILILEDQEDNLRGITEIVKKVSDQIKVFPVSSLEAAREILKDEKNSIQAFLLDINLDPKDENDESGLVFAKEIRQIKAYAFTPIVMITSIANLELKAYREFQCYQYILKPYVEEKIIKLMKNVLFQEGITTEASIVVKKEGINYKLLCKNIKFIQAIPRGISIALENKQGKNEKIDVPYITLKQILEKLPQEEFFQCHRMYVVNQNAIQCIDLVNRMITLLNGEEVEIGVTYKNEVKRRMDG